MPATADAFRQFWFPGINEVTGRPPLGVREFLAKGEFQLYDPFTPNGFIASISTVDSLRKAFASDCNRLATASGESMQSIETVVALPKSIAWALVKCYYAAFYSAHALLRVTGRSLTYLDPDDLRRLNELGPIFGVDGGIKMASGPYICRMDSASKKLTCRNVHGDSHAEMWREFDATIRDFSDQLLRLTPLGSPIYDVGLTLSDLSVLLHSGNCSRGQWLSKIRNDINYRQGHGVWFPYGVHNSESILRRLTEWAMVDHATNVRRSHTGDIDRFLSACLYIIAFNRDVVSDLSLRCPRGTSFLANGAMKLLKLTDAA